MDLLSLGERVTESFVLVSVYGFYTNLERFGPLVIWEEFPQFSDLVRTEDNLRLEIFLVDLTDKFPASATWWQDVEFAVSLISPNCHDFGDPVLAGGDHRRDGAMLGTKAGAGPGIDANPRVHIAVVGKQCCTHVTHQSAVGGGARFQHPCRAQNQFLVCHPNDSSIDAEQSGRD
jgi:hypothetical protein